MIHKYLFKEDILIIEIVLNIFELLE